MARRSLQLVSSLSPPPYLFSLSSEYLTRRALGTAFATRSESSFEARSQEEKLRTDGQQWEVVNSPVSDNQNSQTDPPARAMSSHFDFHVGWGKWKFTLFSWDVNVKM